VILDQHAADVFVGLRGAEQHAIRHNHSRPSASAHQVQEKTHEQQLGFFCFDDLQQVLCRRVIVQ